MAVSKFLCSAFISQVHPLQLAPSDRQCSSPSRLSVYSSHRVKQVKVSKTPCELHNNNNNSNNNNSNNNNNNNSNTLLVLLHKNIWMI